MNGPRYAPPLAGHAGPLKCGRLLRFPDESSRCPNDPTFHVIWTEEVDNGLVCDNHATEACERMRFYAIHPYGMECSMPGAMYDHDRNLCFVDEDELGLQTVEAVSVGATHNDESRAE